MALIGSDVRVPGDEGFLRAEPEIYAQAGRSLADTAIVQELLAQITWYHHIAILDKVKDPVEREWYIHETIRNSWSRNVLVHQIHPSSR